MPDARAERPLILSIDSSGSRSHAAVLLAQEVKAQGSSSDEWRAEQLSDVIEQLFSSDGLSRGEVGQIVVATGPGSFTGIRGGISTALGIGLGLDCDIIGVPTLVGGLMLRKSGLPGAVVTLAATPTDSYVAFFSFSSGPDKHPKLLAPFQAALTSDVSRIAGELGLAAEETEFLDYGVAQIGGGDLQHLNSAALIALATSLSPVDCEGGFLCRPIGSGRLVADYVRETSALTIVERRARQAGR